MRTSMRLVQLCLCVSFLALLATPTLGDENALKSVKVQVDHAPIQLLTKPPGVTPEEQSLLEKRLDDLARIRQKIVQERVNPYAQHLTTPMGPRTSAAFALPNAPTAPGDFALYRSTLMTDVFTNNSTSSTNEPSTGMGCNEVFYSGNWYASLSTDYGQTFTYVNPYAYFTGFCCDQVVYYEGSRGLMFWYLQQSFSFTGNTVRLAVTDDVGNITGSLWNYDITPGTLGFSADVNFDFPDLSVSDNNLYITTNAFSITTTDTSFVAAIAMRIDLDELAAGGAINIGWFQSDLGTLRPTHGATTTMYFGTHVDDSNIRIYSLDEGSNTVNSTDEGHATYYFGPSAPSPDGTDWLDFADGRILGAWVASGTVGFMWHSAAGGPYAQANVRWVRFDEGTLTLDDEGAIWHDDYAWAYPSVHPNDSGDLAGTINVGGGGNAVPYPNLQAWISDSYNSDALAPLENYTIATSTDGPTRDRWGDYNTSRRNDPYGNTWNGTGFVLNGGQTGGFVDPYFLWFGRQVNTPDVGPTITCPADVTIECAGNCGVQQDDPQLAAFFAGVSASATCGPVTISDNAPSCFPVGTTTVTFTATDDGGETDVCTADVTVVDDTADGLLSGPYYG